MSNPFTKGKVASRTGNAVLSDSDVRQIRIHAKTHTTRDLADIYGVGMETIRKIVRRDSWKWIAEEIDYNAPIPALTGVDTEAAAASFARLQQRLKEGPPTEGSGLAKLIALTAVEGEKVATVDKALTEITEMSVQDRAKAFGAGGQE